MGNEKHTAEIAYTASEVSEAIGCALDQKKLGIYNKTEIDSFLSDVGERLENKSNKQTVTAHTENRDNPHEVTAEQVGAYTKEETAAAIKEGIESVIVQEMGNDATKVVSQKCLTEGLTAYSTALDEQIGALDKSKADSDHVHTAEDVGAYTTKENDMLMYAVPSSGLDIQNGVVLGIGTCRDENIIIPEIDSDGNVVCAVDDFVFGSLLGSDGEFIKRIVFPSSIRELGANIISSKYCPNLRAVFIMNPNIKWIESQTFMLGENVKDVYLGFSRKRWIELNTVDNEHPLISLHDDNIAAGIVPTIHYSHFVTSAEFENAIGNKSDIGHGHIASEIDGVYSSEEVDEKLKNPSYEEEVKLTGITTAVPSYDGASLDIYDNSVSSSAGTFNIDIQGSVRFTCVNQSGGLARISIDGTEVAELTGSGTTEYTFEGNVNSGISVFCSMTGAIFTEFVKKTYVKDAIGNVDSKIGDIDSALDAILAIQAEYIGGDEA